MVWLSSNSPQLNCLTILYNRSIIVTIKKNGFFYSNGNFMARHYTNAQETNISSSKLTVKELVILKLVARGMSDHEIADQLFLSLNTIKWYNRKIFAKLGVCSRTQAVARGHDLHIIDHETAENRLQK